MPLRLPDEKTEDAPKKRAVKVPRPRADQPEPLAPSDTIEYGITLEVSVRRGQKAWIKVGTTSSVRQGETADDAKRRVADWVDRTLDERMEELSE